jgi:maleylpyruvate isomerase
MTSTADPAVLRGWVEVSTGRLLAGTAAITDARAREPSLLPGWTRGHLLTHLARGADGLRNLLTWARTGVMTPQYPSAAARDEDIEAGAGRSAAELRADVAESAAALAAEAASLSEAAWQASVHGIRGKAHPAWYTLTRRLSELEIHHVDLGIGYRVADWPDGFAADRLPDVAGSFVGRDDAPACLVEVTGTGQAFRIGPADAEGTARVSGPPRTVLAWLIGRGDGTGLEVDPAGAPPVLPPW